MNRPVYLVDDDEAVRRAMHGFQSSLLTLALPRPKWASGWPSS